MITRLDALWLKACANPGTEVDIGGIVVCDICNTDYTDSRESGGMIFCSSGVCPRCTHRMLPSIIAYNELHLIRGNAAPGQAFADFIRQFRGPDGNKITVGKTKGKPHGR